MPVTQTKEELLKEQKRARGQAYADMVNSWAWKDLQERMKKMQDKMVNMLDETDPNEINQVHVGIIKGFRKAFKSLNKEVEYILGDK